MTEEVNPISNMIDYITQSEFQKANDVFNDLLGQRVNDSLEQEKVAVAQSMYSSEEEEYDDEETFDEDNEDMEVSDEELETAMADLEDEDFE
jgi:hypothetical protein